MGTKKLLFLGAGGSGKSTLFKQMEILHGIKRDGMEESLAVAEWPKTFKPIVYYNIVRGIKDMAEEYRSMKDDAEETKDQEMLDILQLSPESQHDIDRVYGLRDDDIVDAERAASMERLWKQKAFKYIWKFRGTLQIQDSLAYFLDNINRIGAEDYRPSKDDVLNARSRTTGIVEQRFNVNNHPFIIVDVGGQRSERKKWINCFAEVTAVIFVAALSAFD